MVPPSSGSISKTRICIKNLPMEFKDGDLRSFLRLRFPTTKVTDCRVLMRPTGTSRRMAFCGFLTEEEAKFCAEQLDRSYCRSCRLSASFAVLPAIKTREEEPEQEEPMIKVKCGEPAMKLQKREYMSAMGVGETNGSGKVQSFWANDDGVGTNTPIEDDNDDNSSSNEGSSDPADHLLSGHQMDQDFLRSKQMAVDSFDEAETEDDEAETEDDEEPNTIEEPNAAMNDKSNTQGSGNEKVLSTKTNTLINGNNRLFLRNLPFTATEDEVKTHFSPFGKVLECRLPSSDQVGKGFGFVSFSTVTSAASALKQLDGTDFQGRILHVLPARGAPEADSTKIESHSGSYKANKVRQRRQNAMEETEGWSAGYVRGDAVVDNLVSKLGVQKGTIMSVKDDLSGGDAAVRLALGETSVINENYAYFTNHGYNLETLVSANSNTNGKNCERSKSSILIKNLPFETTQEELSTMASSAGVKPRAVLLAPSRTIAVLQYEHSNEAQSVFRRLAYRRFKNVPLYLEWAPVSQKVEAQQPTASSEPIPIAADERPVEHTGNQTTLYITNLNFKTTEEDLHKIFAASCGGDHIASVRIPKKVGSRKRGHQDSQPEVLSMGYGFVEMRDSNAARKAIQHLHGKLLYGHSLEIAVSRKENKQAASSIGTTSGKNSSKLMVRNVPFQASRKELLQLFGAFGQLKRVRMPKKVDGTNRGFAFVEYQTSKDALHAMKSLSQTHLYGRHLVLEWAEEEK